VNSVEDRLRAAYQAAADTVTREMDVPGLTGSEEPTGPPRRRGSRTAVIRLAAPLAAAAAVAAIALTLSLIATSGGGQAPSQRSGPVPWRLPAATSVGQGYPGNRMPDAARPGHFVGIQVARHGPTEYAFTVYAYSTATGRPTGKLTLPGSGLWARAVASLGHGNYLVAATRDWPHFGCRTWLYQFRLTATGQPAGVKPFVVPQVRGWAWQLSGSGDGQLAVAITMTCGRGHTQFLNSHDDVATAISTSSGATSTWRPWPASSKLVAENEAPSGALDADGRLLPFVAIAGQPKDFGLDVQAAYVMLTGHVGGPVARRYHLVLKPGRNEGVVADALSPNGRVTFVMTASRYGGRWHEVIGAYATATGKLLTILARASAKSVDGDGYLIPDQSGRHLLVMGFGSGNTDVLDIATHRLSSLPVRYPYPPLGAAW
jgi:hypothetical protein